jgi:hypothetical protein
VRCYEADTGDNRVILYFPSSDLIYDTCLRSSHSFNAPLCLLAAAQHMPAVLGFGVCLLPLQGTLLAFRTTIPESSLHLIRLK